MEAILLERQSELGNPASCAKRTETYRTSDICASELCRYGILGSRQPQDSGQMANVAYLPKTQNANVSIWLNGDDLNPLSGHGYTASIVVWGP